MKIYLSELQREIMEFARNTKFHGTLKQFHEYKPECSREELENALKALRRGCLVAPMLELYMSSISVTEAGWRIMGWL